MYIYNKYTYTITHSSAPMDRDASPMCIGWQGLVIHGYLSRAAAVQALQADAEQLRLALDEAQTALAREVALSCR